MKIKVGTRSSSLAVKQTQILICKLQEFFPQLKPYIIHYSSPGDRNKNISLESSSISDNFFTYDLDLALLNNEIDFAIHSAKDLPDYTDTSIDFFWWPFPEDIRDVLVLPEGDSLKKLDQVKTIGVSSPRRRLYVQNHFKGARIKNIRGNISERLQQLDKRKFDMLILAAAGLKRLGLERRISKYLTIKDLSPQNGQGYLGITFRKNNSFMIKIRSMFIPPVVISGAGPGFSGFISKLTDNYMSECDVCLYDGLVSDEIINSIPSSVLKISACKRFKENTLCQSDINQLLLQYARQGKKVLRLKGGDPNIFGRLDEELQILKENHIAVTLIPGISAFQALSQNGIILTKRKRNPHLMISTAVMGNNRLSFRLKKYNHPDNLTHIIYMGIEKIRDIAKTLHSRGYSKELPVFVVSNISRSNETIWQGRLKELLKGKLNKTFLRPGLIVIGKNIDSRIISPVSPLNGKRILLTGTYDTNLKAARRCRYYGAIPFNFPLLNPVLNPDSLKHVKKIKNYDYVIILSPVGAKMLINALKFIKIDLRSIPSIIATGTHSKSELENHGIFDVLLPKQSSIEGLESLLKKLSVKNKKFLLLRSNLASADFDKTLKKMGAKPKRINLYSQKNNQHILPDTDAVAFFSAKGAERFFEKAKSQKKYLEKIKFATIGKSTLKEVEKHFQLKCSMAFEHSAKSVIDVLARDFISDLL